MKMNRPHANLVLFTVLAARSLQAAPMDDLILRDPGILAGPWEGKSGEDLVGLHLLISTNLKGSVEYLTQLQVRVDRIVDGDWG